jgi:hypothetical protein
MTSRGKCHNNGSGRKKVFISKGKGILSRVCIIKKACYIYPKVKEGRHQQRKCLFVAKVTPDNRAKGKMSQLESKQVVKTATTESQATTNEEGQTNYKTS